ncbi:MAG: metallophosphoesterase, partial [Steroidobacteraceae bacterium]
LLAGTMTLIAGGFVGSVIMGLYLLLSVQVFGRHSEQAFSSLRIQDYKSWLRLRIDSQGVLAIFAIAIDRVPRKWRKASEPAPSVWIPDDPRATKPRLIELVRSTARSRS